MAILCKTSVWRSPRFARDDRPISGVFHIILVFIVIFPSVLFADDLSGYYQNKNGSICLMEAGGQVLLSYESVFTKTAHNCGCSATTVLRDGMIPMDKEFGGKGGLKIDDSKLIVVADGNPLCCGAGWPGNDTFDRPKMKKPTICKVNDKSFFYDHKDYDFTQTGKYVISGDSVEVLLQSENQGYVMAKFKGSAKETVAYLKKSTLNCSKH